MKIEAVASNVLKLNFILPKNIGVLLTPKISNCETQSWKVTMKAPKTTKDGDRYGIV